MISGRQALATVEQTITQARREEARLDRALREATDEAVRMRAARSAGFRELAKLKLNMLAREGVVQELDAAERRALAIMEQGRRSAADFANKLDRAEERLEQAQAEHDARAAELDEALAALSELRAQVEAQTRISPEWAQTRERIDELGRMAEAAEKKIAQAEADREEKRKPYESDPLFMYLWNRGFGGTGYSAGRVARFLDRRVARLVGYDKAQPNYVMLNAIPARLREHAERLREELAARRARLKSIERQALETSGSQALEAGMQQCKEALAAAERRLSQSRADYDKLEQQRRDGGAPAEAAYAQAVELLASADAAQDLQSLFREAAMTPDAADEAILRRIEAAEAAIGRAEKETGAIRREMNELARRRKQIERERDEFRRRGYDGPFGSFGNERVLASVLGGILGGVLQGTVLRDVFKEGYRRQPGPWDSDFGGDWFPGGGNDGFGTSGSTGGDGFHTGGSMGGDGFRTGGSF